MAQPPQSLMLMQIAFLLPFAFPLEALAAPAPVPTPSPAPSPAPPPFCNITEIIESAGQFLNFLQLLSETGVDKKLQDQANQTSIGITVFAPTDKAFARAPASTLLKSLTTQQKVSLCEYHAMAKWYSLASLQQTDNNVTSTFATYNGGGKYTFNVTDQDGTVNIKTGWSTADIVSTLYNAAPCSIFAIDEVLLPEDIFGLPSPPPAPAPSAGSPLISPSSATLASSSSSSPPSPHGKSTASGSATDSSLASPLRPFQALLVTSLLCAFNICLL